VTSFRVCGSLLTMASRYQVLCVTLFAPFWRVTRREQRGSHSKFGETAVSFSKIGS